MSDHSIDTRNSNNKQVDASFLSSMEEDQISTNNTSSSQTNDDDDDETSQEELSTVRIIK